MEFYLPVIGKVIVYTAPPALLRTAPALAGLTLQLDEPAALAIFPLPYIYRGMIGQDLCFEILQNNTGLHLLHIRYEDKNSLTIYTRNKPVELIYRGCWQWKHGLDKNLSKLF